MLGRVPQRTRPPAAHPRHNLTLTLTSDGRRLDLDAPIGLLATCPSQPLRHATPRLVGPPFILVE
eukprot:7020131-Prymnesium_polylepis.1